MTFIYINLLFYMLQNKKFRMYAFVLESIKFYSITVI